MAKRTIMEWGSGADIHGEDPLKAVSRAVSDAIHHSCLNAYACGHIDEPLTLRVNIACPDAYRLRESDVRELFPVGDVQSVAIKDGGLLCPNGTLIALAAIEIDLE